MAKGDGLKYVKKAYLWLSLAVVAVIWACFFGSLFFGRLSHGPVEDTWFEEVTKWLFCTPFLVIIVDVIAYAVIMTNALRKEHDIDRPFWEELKEFVQGKLGSLKSLKHSEEENEENKE